jgi:hypothetical protein
MEPGVASRRNSQRTHIADLHGGAEHAHDAGSNREVETITMMSTTGMLVRLRIARSALSLAALGAIAEVGRSAGSSADIWIPLGEGAAGDMHHRCGQRVVGQRG